MRPLGTFAGMIVTMAAPPRPGQQHRTSAIRSALAAPIAGLVAFGTSIAGVAASAMLGLASTLTPGPVAGFPRTG